jgi:hypothetical protein
MTIGPVATLVTDAVARDWIAAAKRRANERNVPDPDGASGAALLRLVVHVDRTGSLPDRAASRRMIDWAISDHARKHGAWSRAQSVGRLDDTVDVCGDHPAGSDVRPHVVPVDWRAEAAFAAVDDLDQFDSVVRDLRPLLTEIERRVLGELAAGVPAHRVARLVGVHESRISQHRARLATKFLRLRRLP